MSQLKILIVEDDFGNAVSLETLVHELGYQTVDTVDNSTDALLRIKETDPDLVIMDIDIKGELDGIEVAHKINDKSLPIIFVTGLDSKETYEKAKAVLPVAYIVKPFNSFTLQSSIEFAFKSAKSENRKTDTWGEDVLLKDNFFIKKNNKLEKVGFAEIFYIQSEGNYSVLQTKEKKYVVKISLSKMIEKLPQNQFIRVHQRYIIQANLIKNIDFHASNINVTGLDIPIGRSYKNSLLKIINRL